MKVYVVVCESWHKELDSEMSTCGAFETEEEAVKHARKVFHNFGEDWGVPVYTCTVHEAEMDPYLLDAMSLGFGWSGGLDERCVWRGVASNNFNRMDADEQALWEKMEVVS